MPTSVFLAKLIGPVFVVGAAGMLLNGAVFRALLQEFLRSHALIFLSGILTMTAGVAIVLTHNVWAADWRVMITILGWLAAIGGAVRIAAPHWTASVGTWWLGRTGLTVGAGIWLLFGLLFCFFGYLR